MSEKVNIHDWTHKGGVIIVLVATLALIIIPGIAILKRSSNDVKECRVEFAYKLIPDSVAIDAEYYFSKAQMDSVMKQLEYHEAVLNNKFQTLLSQKAEEDWIKDLFVYVFGIVVAVLGFFGYRSFTDLEEKTIKIANEKAKETAQAAVPAITANKVATECSSKVPIEVRNYLATHLTQKVNEKIDTYFQGDGKNVIETVVQREVRSQLSIRNLQEENNPVDNIEAGQMAIEDRDVQENIQNEAVDNEERIARTEDVDEIDHPTSNRNNIDEML